MSYLTSSLFCGLITDSIRMLSVTNCRLRGVERRCLVPPSPTQKVQRLKKKILDLGPIHPGRITQQFNVCGTPGCRCKDPKRPRKHGPYHNLSYTFQGRSRTLFIRPECVAEMKRRTQRYGKWRELVEQFIQASIDSAREEVLSRDGKA